MASNLQISDREQERRKAQSEFDKKTGHGWKSGPVPVEDRGIELLSRDDIETEYGLGKRWLELAALSGNGPPYVKISRRMVRYQRGAFEAWLASRTVTSTSMELAS